MRVKCLAQEHNTVSPARARTWNARSVDERTNHEATAPPTNMIKQRKKTGGRGELPYKNNRVLIVPSGGSKSGFGTC